MKSKPSRTVGNKTYELKVEFYEIPDASGKHLGNVRATVSDLRTMQNSLAKANVQSYNNYYPFGMLMPGRWNSSEGYRYGFNGKEMDDDMRGGTGVTYDYGFRIYDSRIAKFLSVDPLTKDYPWYTPYQFAGNKPIWAIDLDGLEEFYTTSGEYIYGHQFNGVIYIVDDSYLDVQQEIAGWRYVDTRGTQKPVFNYAKYDYKGLTSGSLDKNSPEYENLMRHSNRNKIGDAVLEIYYDNPLIDGDILAGNVCTQASYARTSKGYEKATGKSFPEVGSDFYQIWSVYVDGTDEKLGVRSDLVNYGSPAALVWMGIGTVHNADAIWEGKMKPGNPIMYQGASSHSMIFLGYTFDDDGNINGFYQWDQHTQKGDPKIKKREDNYDLKGGEFNE